MDAVDAPRAPPKHWNRAKESRSEAAQLPVKREGRVVAAAQRDQPVQRNAKRKTRPTLLPAAASAAQSESHESLEDAQSSSESDGPAVGANAALQGGERTRRGRI